MTTVGSWPAVNVNCRGMVACVEGLATMSERGYAVGLDETSVNETSGGGDTELTGAEVDEDEEEADTDVS